jgi:hypothetical protein
VGAGQRQQTRLGAGNVAGEDRLKADESLKLAVTFLFYRRGQFLLLHRAKNLYPRPSAPSSGGKSSMASAVCDLEREMLASAHLGRNENGHRQIQPHGGSRYAFH